MIFFNLFRAPKNKIKIEGKPFLKQVGMIVLSTTISLSFTLGVLQLLEAQNKKKDRRMSAMMVLSNIESFARMLDGQAERMAYPDSVGVWLMAQPLECLDTLPEQRLLDLVQESLLLDEIQHDHSAENIFSNDISIWKNLGNFAFIDKVGQCFSEINFVERYWNAWTGEVEELIKKIVNNPENYEGVNLGSKLIHNYEMRRNIKVIHERRDWLRYVAALMRYENRYNMKAIGITEEEVMKFTNRRTEEEDYDGKSPTNEDYVTPYLKLDSSLGVWKKLSQTRAD